MKANFKDVLIRALKTFWQATLASIMIAIPEVIELIPSGWVAIKPVLISAIVGALAAGLSAVYNGVIAPLIHKNGGEASIDEGK